MEVGDADADVKVADSERQAAIEQIMIIMSGDQELVEFALEQLRESAHNV